MLSIKECRKYLKKFNLTDEEVEELRNTLYCICENIIDNYIKRNGKQKDDKAVQLV